MTTHCYCCRWTKPWPLLTALVLCLGSSVGFGAQLPEVSERDPSRLYLASPAAAMLPRDAAPVETQTDPITQAEADEWFAEARQLAEAGREGPAYRRLFEILLRCPDHEPTLKLLGPTLRILRPDDQPLRAITANRPERTFGWSGGEWRRVDSPHFAVIGSASAEELIEVAERVERLYLAWDQAFYEVWSPQGRLTRAFNNSSALSRTQSRKSTVVLFANREEYQAKLRGVAPNVEVSLGYYAPARRQAMFFAGDESARASLLHEVTHQLFQERLGAKGNAGDRSNFWLVEGIATVLESLEDYGEYLTIGGYDAERLQYARFNVFSGKVLIPFEEIVQLGQDDFQNDPEVRRLYTQASGMASWLLLDPQEQRTEVLADLLRELYDGRHDPERLSKGLGLSWDECVQQYIAYLRPLKTQVDPYPPRPTTTCLAFCYGDIDDRTLASLPHLEQLEWIDLTHAPISNRGVTQLDRFPALRQLILTATAVTDDVADEVAKVTSLEELDLSATRITGAGLAKLAALPNLEVLVLNDTSLTDADLDTLARFPALIQVDLKGTQVTAAKAAELERALSRRRER